MKRTIGNGALALGFAVLLAGCGDASTGSGGNETANEAESNGTTADAGAKDVEAASTAQATADLAGARQLIDTIYAPYTRGEVADPSASLSPELLAALNRDGSGLDADPFCDCQDFEQFSYSVQSLEPTANGAVARVSISNFGQSKIIVVHLVQSGGSWKVADVGDGPNSMMQALSR